MKIEDTGADGIELNYGCPQGMSERGMGAAVGQVPEMCELNTHWVTSITKLPVIVKLTPNITHIIEPAHAALAGGAHALSLINTINRIMNVDLDTLMITPNIGGRGTHGGYAGPAVKPIALNMLTELMTDAGVLRSGRADLRHGRHRRPGGTPPSSCCWAPPPCRSAPPPCTTATAS